MRSARCHRDGQRLQRAEPTLTMLRGKLLR